MSKILQVFYSLFSAILLSLAIQNEFIPWGSPFLGLFALVPLYFALSQSQSAKQSGLLFSIMISLSHILSSFWLSNFKDFAIFTIGGSTLWYTVSCYFLGQLFYGVFFIQPSKQLTIDSGTNFWHIPKRVLLFPSLYILFEWQKSTGFLAYPWGTLYMSSYSWKIFTQIAAITGTLGISWLFAFFSAIFAEGLILITKRPIFSKMHRSYSSLAAILILFFMLSMVYGTIVFTKQKTIVDYIDVILVQQNTDSWENEYEGDKKGILISQALTEKSLGQMENNADLIVWSESNINSIYLPDYYDQLEYYPPENPLLPFIREKQIPFAIGGIVRLAHKEKKSDLDNHFFHKKKYGNAILIFGKNADFLGYSAKIQLVPFAEAIPYEDTEWMQIFMEKIAGFSNGWAAGDEIRLFPIKLKSGNTIHIANLVCFEDAFTDVCRQHNDLGADIFVNLTNDSWSKTHSAEIQHFVVSSFRAIEYRKPLIRSTNSGYTVAVDAYGNRLADLELFTRDSLSVQIPLYEKTESIYARLGNWPPLTAAIFVLFISFLYLVTIIKELLNDRKIQKQNQKKLEENFALCIEENKIENNE